MSELANDSTKFANNVFNATNEQLEDTISPRARTMQTFAESSDSVVTSVREGREKIENVSRKQCDTADELRSGVEKEFNRFGNEVANKRRAGIDQQKSSLVDNTQGFSKTSNEALSYGVSSASKTKSVIDHFATKTIKMKDGIPPLGERKDIRYSKTLSSTHAESILIKDVVAENE